ncbi:ABC transporter ATP-binding protein [Pararhodospirillum photometricum]|uniref:ABC transporter component n=1 Tax=Pararhodospirillum photometricum DSM 122 TaxID=1150469 RepID=H6SL21_PARPM|nr:ATP-binding cassette domain-containing protein [Pararhodospirillum photometricum]CCG08686.1 ABC transporter component [Pararhodospirillum photometricum DSM 122]
MMSSFVAPTVPAAAKITVRDLAIGFGATVIQHDVSFEVPTGAIFAIMGGSGCGKSTLLKAMIGLLRPQAGTIHVGDEDYWAADAPRRAVLGRRFGVLFQSGALWSSMTVAQNVALPLSLLTSLDPASINALVHVKLSLVGLAGAADVLPAALSGGMRKRAGLARALALDPEVLFFDEPSAGLDPITARRLDDLILEVRDGFGTTIVLVSHELPSLFGICDNGVFLDADTKTVLAHGAPTLLRDTCAHPTVHAFMTRSRPSGAPGGPGAGPGESRRGV